MTDENSAALPARTYAQVVKDFIQNSEVFSPEGKADLVKWIEWFELFPGTGKFDPVDSTTVIRYYPVYKQVIGHYTAEMKALLAQVEAGRARAFSRCRSQARKNMPKPTVADVEMVANTDRGYMDAVDRSIMLQQHVDMMMAMAFSLPPELITQYANNERSERRQDTQ